MKVGLATASESDAERHFRGAKAHLTDVRSKLDTEHVGRLVFTREEILKELAKEAAAVYTTEWLERLDANGELEEGQLEPPEGPSPALEEREPSGEEVIAAAAEVAATIAAAAAEIVAAATAAAAAAATAAATATAPAPSE